MVCLTADVGSNRVGGVVVDWCLTPLLVEDNVDDIILLNRELSSLVGDGVGKPSEEAALGSSGALAVGVSPGVLAPWEVDTIASISVSPLLGVASGNSAPGNTCTFLASSEGLGNTGSDISVLELEALSAITESGSWFGSGETSLFNISPAIGGDGGSSEGP